MSNGDFALRFAEPRDFGQISELCRSVYPNEKPWTAEQLASHLRVFPEGQFVALDRGLDLAIMLSCSLRPSSRRRRCACRALAMPSAG